MPTYQCARCVKKYLDEREGPLLCPFCRCRVIEYHGPAPLNPSRAPLLAAQAAATPQPLVPEFRFELIALTPANADFWLDYARAMRLIAMQSHFDKAVKDGYANAVKGFTDAVQTLEDSPGSQVWIAVGSHGEVLQEQFAVSACRIEICMTVTTHPDVPFTTHMGIFRTPLRRLAPGDFEPVRHQDMYRVGTVIRLLETRLVETRATPEISCQLHAFAAERCLRICRGRPKEYMITAPLKKMKEIIEAAFGSDATSAIELRTDASAPWQLLVGGRVLPIDRDLFRKCPWASRLTDLDGGRPKIAVPLETLAGRLEEHARVAAILNWLDKKR